MLRSAPHCIAVAIPNRVSSSQNDSGTSGTQPASQTTDESAFVLKVVMGTLRMQQRQNESAQVVLSTRT